MGNGILEPDAEKVSCVSVGRAAAMGCEYFERLLSVSMPKVQRDVSDLRVGYGWR